MSLRHLVGLFQYQRISCFLTRCSRSKAYTLQCQYLVAFKKCFGVPGLAWIRPCFQIPPRVPGPSLQAVTPFFVHSRARTLPVWERWQGQCSYQRGAMRVVPHRLTVTDGGLSHCGTEFSVLLNFWVQGIYDLKSKV